MLDPKGRLHFLGRLDDQVKLRGHRIELGEVEAALEGRAGIKECAVRIVERPVVGAQLIAYAVAEEGLDPRSVRTELLETLPMYMVPGKVVRVERLPRLPSGKVDRGALGEIEREVVA
jgi:acyl-coenzyme A synthetase/AMP-(fatty) acid ligase